jgi:hypothetical protein
LCRLHVAAAIARLGNPIADCYEDFQEAGIKLARFCMVVAFRQNR